MIIPAMTDPRAFLSIRDKRRILADENRRFTAELVEIKFAPLAHPRAPRRAWRSRDFLVQLYCEPSGQRRLSINRTEIDSDGQWKDGITWDQLQRLKTQAGFGTVQAIEFFPPDDQLVYDANIRHLFLMDSPLPFCWTAENGGPARPLSDER